MEESGNRARIPGQNQEQLILARRLRVLSVGGNSWGKVRRARIFQQYLDDDRK